MMSPSKKGTLTLGSLISVLALGEVENWFECSSGQFLHQGRVSLLLFLSPFPIAGLSCLPLRGWHP